MGIRKRYDECKIRDNRIKHIDGWISRSSDPRARDVRHKINPASRLRGLCPLATAAAAGQTLLSSSRQRWGERESELFCELRAVVARVPLLVVARCLISLSPLFAFYSLGVGRVADVGQVSSIRRDDFSLG